jgi:hypothetical protein
MSAVLPIVAMIQKGLPTLENSLRFRVFTGCVVFPPVSMEAAYSNAASSSVSTNIARKRARMFSFKFKMTS